MKESCPGSNEIRQPYPETLVCTFCGHANEIWSDEPDMDCEACKKPINRKMKPNCILWCQFARECVGAEKYDRLIKGLKESEQASK